MTTSRPMCLPRHHAMLERQFHYWYHVNPSRVLVLFRDLQGYGANAAAVMISGAADAMSHDKSSCSCLEGNPCLQADNCSNWKDRCLFAFVAARMFVLIGQVAGSLWFVFERLHCSAAWTLRRRFTRLSETRWSMGHRFKIAHHTRMERYWSHVCPPTSDECPRDPALHLSVPLNGLHTCCNRTHPFVSGVHTLQAG